MTTEIQWSQESYRLDKVVDTFDMPCVVRLENTFLHPDLAGKLGHGDVITLDSEIACDKVAANFSDCELEQEIFLPYNYYGKLHVLKRITTVYTVKDLANIFPGYAELGEKITIKTDDDGSITLAKGKVIEIDRVIPGFMNGLKKEPDELVINFQHSKLNKVAAIPFNMKKTFHTKEDPKKYNIKKALSRYGLPLDVEFLNDEIREKFNQEVFEGRRTVLATTDKLRLNRIVPQRVIVGHLIHDTRSHSGECKRPKTAMIIPIDAEETGRITVNVCKGDILAVHKSLVDDKTVTEACDLAAQSLRFDLIQKPKLKFFISDRSHVKRRDHITHHMPANSDSMEDDDGYLMPSTGIRANDLDGAKPPVPPRMPSSFRPPSRSQSPFRPPLRSQSPFRPPPRSQSPFRPPLRSQSPFRPPLRSQSLFRPPLRSTSPIRPPPRSPRPFRLPPRLPISR